MNHFSPIRLILIKINDGRSDRIIQAFLQCNTFISRRMSEIREDQTEIWSFEESQSLILDNNPICEMNTIYVNFRCKLPSFLLLYFQMVSVIELNESVRLPGAELLIIPTDSHVHRCKQPCLNAKCVDVHTNN